MSEQEAEQQKPAAGWRLKAGIAIFILSIVLPVIAVPTVMAFDLTASIKTTISGALLIGAEVLGVAAVAVMGKPGFVFFKGKVLGLFKQYGPPQEVSRRRYNIGLVMFCAPLLFGLISVYAYEYIPGYSTNPVPYAVSGDLLLLTSLFVLGGDFWDKLRALFVYNEKICRPQMTEQKRPG
jgi:hypothetical protein